MKNRIEYHTLFETLFETVKQAGIVARMLQASIHNDGKQIATIEDESLVHKAMREAKTKADEIVQEMLLSSLWEYRDLVSLDAEEDTPLISAFTKKDFEYSIVIDPIDGTLAYVEQKDTYSICISLLHKQDVKLTIVYFPKRDQMFTYVEGRGVVVYEQASIKQIIEGNVLDVTRHLPLPKQIYKNHRLQEAYMQALVKEGYEVIDDSDNGMCCPDAIYACLCGEALAYVTKRGNTRDIMMGMILAKCQHGFLCDFQGNDYHWLPYGRQKEIIFSAYADELKKITQKIK